MPPRNLYAANDEPQPTAHDVTERGFFFCPSVKHAIVPPTLVQQAVTEAGVHQEEDGFWYFEVRPVCHNQCLRVRPVPKRFFSFERQTEHSGLKVVSRTLDAVSIISARWGEIHVYFHGGPKTLYVWRVGRSIYLRKRLTEEEWAALTPTIRADLQAYEALTQTLS